MPVKFKIVLFLSFIFTTICYGQSTDQSIRMAVDIMIQQANKSLNEYPDSSFVYTRQALRLAKEYNYEAGEAKCHHILGAIFYHQAAYDQSLHNYMLGTEYFRKGDMKRELAEGYHNMGLVYYASKQPELALKNQRLAYQLYEDIADTFGIAQVQAGIGHLFEKKQAYDSALIYQRSALDLYGLLNDTVGLARVMENIGSVYEDLAQYDTAYYYFKKSYLYNLQKENSYELMNNLNNLGDIFRKTGQYEEALIYSHKALKLSIEMAEKNQESSALRDLGKIYHAMGNDSLAYYYLDNGRELYERIYTEESAKQIALLQTLFEIEKMNNEIDLLDQKQKVSMLTKIIAIVITISLIIMGLTIISRQRLKIRKNRELLKEREKAFETKNHLMQVELDNNKLAEEQLQNELKAKSKELTTHTLHAITKNQILDELKNDIQRLLKDDSRGQKKDLKNIIKKIDLNFQKDNEWEEFRMIFEKVHESFYHKLMAYMPDLTTSEKRLAALLKLNMNSNDIATIMAISYDSLRIARYRLRKKLSVPKGEKLETFIQRF